MSVENIKPILAALSAAEQREITAFLFNLRHAADAEYQDRVHARLSDHNSAHWLTPEEFERQLEGK